jgi:hypothetical protein
VTTRGEAWTAAQLAGEIVAIVLRSTTTDLRRTCIIRSSSFADDVHWDDWFKMGLRKPVERRLHESVSAFLIMERVKTVGGLADLVWSKMEPA